MADQTSFQPGDVVQLKSGSSPMTVYGSSADGESIYVYYAGTNGIVQEYPGSIPAVVLKKIESPTELYTGSLPVSGGA